MTTTPPRLPVASQWWAAARVSPQVTRIWEPHVVPLLRCNIWHVRGRDRDLVVDTGLGVAPLRAAFPALFQREPVVVITHSHYDHVGGLHEFADRRGHPLEAELVAVPPIPVGAGLVAAGISSEELRHLLEVGYEVPPVLLGAVPSRDYDIDAFEVRPAALTSFLDEGDRVDLGDRSLTVLHLPGHTPGSIGLFDEASGELFSGDALYDGPLLDGLEESDQSRYVETMGRLLDLPVSLVLPGHEEIFGPDRLAQLVRAYLDIRGPLEGTPDPTPIKSQGARP